MLFLGRRCVITTLNSKFHSHSVMSEDTFYNNSVSSYYVASLFRTIRLLFSKVIHSALKIKSRWQLSLTFSHRRAVVHTQIHRLTQIMQEMHMNVHRRLRYGMFSFVPIGSFFRSVSPFVEQPTPS